MAKEAEVNFISECFIQPNREVVSEALKEPYHLSPMDLDMLCSDHMQKGFMYTKPTYNNVGFQTEVFLQKLKHSLSLSLLHFYPLAGRFATRTFPDEHACCIFLDCVNSPGPRFIHASLDSTVSDILSCTDEVHPIFRSFFDLGDKRVNYDGHTNALLSLQVTELVDGIFIGFSLSHSVGDGTSLTHYITTLSEIFNSVGNKLQNGEELKISRKPIFKPFFPDGYGPFLKLPYVEPSEFLSRKTPAPIRVKIFHFSRVSISRLKARANNNICDGGTHKYEISSFQALSGLIWRAITRARKLDPAIETNCSLAMNLRPRLIPPLPQEFFGNYFSRIKASCKVGELLNTDLGWGSLLLHVSLKKVDDKAIIESFRRYCEAPIIGQLANDSAFFGVNFVKIVGSHRSNLFGTEFGMGRPVAIRAGSGNKVDGRVTASQGSEGAGSVDLEVCLAPPTMNALETDQEFMSFVTLA